MSALLDLYFDTYHRLFLPVALPLIRQWLLTQTRGEELANGSAKSNHLNRVKARLE